MTTIRRFCCNDFLRFSSVNLDHLTITGGTRTYLSWLAQWPDHFIVAVAPGNRIMGYILAAVQGDGEGAGSLAVAGVQEEGEGWFGQITTVSVHPEYRKQGLGTRLMILFESQLLDKMFFSPGDLLHSIRCYVGVTNRPARIFFGKFGFENHRCLGKLIAKKEDAVDMRKVLVEGGDFEVVRLSTSDVTQKISGKKVMRDGGIEIVMKDEVIEMESSGAAVTAGEEVVVPEVAEAATATAVEIVAEVAEAATVVVAEEGEVVVAQVAEAATAIVAAGEVVVAEVAEAATAVVAGEVVVAEVAEAAAVAGKVVVAEVAETTTTTKKPTRLEQRWTLWFHNQSSKPKQRTAWGSSLRKVYSFDTVENFWGMYDQIIRPSKVPGSADFHLFKEGVEPKWEDPECANGGKWSVNCSRKTNLETMWLETLMALIGEQFDENESDEICGVVVSLRQWQDKLALWTKTATDEATQMSIGRKWKEIIDTDEKITYSFHDYNKREKSAKARYYV